MSEFGEYLKELRGNKSFREMERITGLSHTYLSTLEKGVDPRSGKERKPTPETLMQLSKTLKVSYSELMEKAGYKEAKNSLEIAFHNFLGISEKVKYATEMRERNKSHITHLQKMKPNIEESIKKTKAEIEKIKNELNSSDTTKQIELLQKQIMLVTSLEAAVYDLDRVKKDIEQFSSEKWDKYNENLITPLSIAKEELINQIEKSFNNSIKKLEEN